MWKCDNKNEISDINTASSSRWPSPKTSHIGLLSDVIEGSFGLLLSLEDRKVGGAKWSTPQILLFGLTISPLPFFRLNNCKYKP